MPENTTTSPGDTKAALPPATCSAWHRRSRFAKAVNGWFCYQLASWVSLFFPVEVDKAMHVSLCEQFSDLPKRKTNVVLVRYQPDDITDDQVEEVESECGMGANAWDCISPKEIIAAAWNLFQRKPNMHVSNPLPNK